MGGVIDLADIDVEHDMVLICSGERTTQIICRRSCMQARSRMDLVWIPADNGSCGTSF